MHYLMRTLQFFRYYRLPSAIILFWLLLVSPLYFPNMGGSGLRLPQNIITWAVMGIVTFSIWFTLRTGQAVRITTTANGLLLAVVVLGIPLIYTAPLWRDAALARWAGLLGGWFFYLSLLQCNRQYLFRNCLYYAILATATFQMLIGILQFTVPNIIPAWFAYPVTNNRVHGVFQQVNVLASFVATGFALTLMLFLLPKFTCSRATNERLRSYGLGVLLVLFSVLLVWLQSRIGWIGGATITVLFLYHFKHVSPQRRKWAAFLISLGILIGLIALWQGLYDENGLRYVSHNSSNNSRYTMLRDTLTMIGQKPLYGWGYGGFEYSFQHFRLTYTPLNIITEIARHPHNELLLWWVEGGLVALAGMLIVLVYAVRLLRAALTHDGAKKQTSTGEASALCIVLLPILLHTQTEYPFTLSTFHWAIFLLLLAQLDRLVSRVNAPRSLSAPISYVLAGTIPILSTIVLLMLGCGLYANFALTSVERNHFASIEPARMAMKYDMWVNTERWEYDQQTYNLLDFNQSRNPTLLDSYERWAKGYLSRRIDDNVYAAWLAIAQYRQDEQTQHRLRKEGQWFFPGDKRFIAP